MSEIINTLDVSDDLPRSTFPTDVPFWSESFAFWAYPDGGDFDLYVHYQRQVRDPGIWKGMFVLLLADGEALVVKHGGRQIDPTGPGAHGMYAKCLEPGRRWWFQFDSLAYRVKQADMWKQEIRDAVFEPVFIEIEFDALAPLWCLDPDNLGRHEGNVMMSSHYEQAYRVRGRVRLDAGEERRFEGLGYRDHSYGPRNYTRLGGASQIVYGLFPSGRAYWFITGTTPEGELVHCEGAMAVDGKSYPIELIEFPDHRLLVEGTESELVYAFRSELGEQRVRVTYSGIGMPFSIMPPAEEVIGLIGGLESNPHRYWESMLISEWDGERGVGSGQGVA